MTDSQGPAEAPKDSFLAFFGEANPFKAMREEMDRMFHAFSMPQMKWNTEMAGNTGVVSLHVDIAETDDEIQIKADLPGIEEDNVEVTLDDDFLCLRVEKKSESATDEKNWKVVERSHDLFERRIRVPDGIDPDQMAATFYKGVLTVTMPKPATTEPPARRIAIKRAN